MSPYEAACERFNAAARKLDPAREEAQRIIDAAHAEYEAALADLHKYEAAPGIPKPEYRQQWTADSV